MKKMYLMNGLAVAALALATTSCHKDLGGFSYSEEDALANAELQLGVQIDPNQTWRMTQSVDASVTVNLGIDQQYTVAIYDQNPLTQSDVTYFVKETIAEGGKISKNIKVPAGANNLYVAVFDSKLRRVVEQATIKDGAINVNVGSNSVTRVNRAVEADYTDSYAKTAADYLNQLTVTDMQEYTTFDNATIDLYSAVLTNAIDGRGEAYYRVPSTLTPTNGMTVNITDDGGMVLGTVTFHGTCKPAVANDFQSGNGFSAYIACSAISVTPNVNCQLTSYIDDSYALFGWTDNGVGITPSWGGAAYNGENTYFRGNPYLSNAQAGHTYRMWRGNNDLLPYYGSKIYYEYHTKYLGDGRHFRVPVGTTISKSFSCNGNSANHQPMEDGSVIYVEGTLNVYGYENNKNTFNSASIVVGNGGKVILNGAVDMSNTGRIVVLPGGELTGTEGSSLTVANGAKCYNAGKIEFKGELNTNGSDFYNNGTINVTTFRNTSGGKITNFGSIIAGNNTGAADAYNCEFINGCFWKYTGDAGIGQLTMLENSRLEIGGKAEFTQNHTSQDEPIANATPNILMANSVVKVRDCYPTNTIFQGPTESGKVGIVQITGKLMVGRAMDITQWDNCYFDWDAEQIYNKEGEKQTLAMEDGEHGIYSGVHARITKFVSEATSPYIIPEGTCTGDGYNPDGSTEKIIPGAEPIYSYAFEDTHNGDYDMNDVVLKVQEFTEDDVQKLRIKLVAIGATLNLNIRLYPAAEPGDGEVAHYAGDFTVLEYNNKTEVHEMLGVEQGMMFNTGWNGNKVQPITIVINKGNYDPAALPIAIYSEAQGEIRLAGAGQAPYGVVIPEDWKWPTERTNIETAYNNTNTASEGNQSFANFASHAGESKNWFKYPTQKVMNEATLGY